MWAVVCIGYDDDYKHCEEPACLRYVRGFATMREAEEDVIREKRNIIEVRATEDDWKQISDLPMPKLWDELSDCEVEELSDIVLKAYYYEGVTMTWHVEEI
jgi:hypothetical protein